MARVDDDEDDEVNPLNIKQNLNNYTYKKLIKLANVLINSLCELTVEKGNFL